MNDPLSFLAGGGEAERMIRERNWTGHPMGLPETWPAEFKAALSLVLNSPESMILAWGPDLSFFFNETYFPLLGPRLPWAMGARFDKVWEDGWEQAKPIIDAAFAGTPERFNDLPWKLGEDRGARDTWWSFSYSRVLDATGAIAGLFIFTNETTQRVLADEQLRASQALVQENVERIQLALAAGAIIGTWFWDIPGDRFTVDEAFARAFGLDPALGREGIPLAQIVATVHPDDQAGLAAAIEEAIARGGAYAHQYRVRRADGRYYWIEANGRVNRAPDGTAVSFPGVLLDIEERRTAQEALRESEAHWRGLFERLSEGFIVGEVVRDAAGSIVDWRYIDVNTAWGNLVDIDPASAIGRTIREVLPGIEDAWVDEFADVVRTGQPMSFTRQVGTLARWYDGRAFPLAGDRFGVLFLDATARIQAEARRGALLDFASRLRESPDAATVALDGAEAVGRALAIGRVGYGTVGPDGETFTVERDWTAPGFPTLAGCYRMSDYGLYADDLRQGRTVVIPDTRHDPRTVADADTLARAAVRSLVNVPVVEQGRTVAVLYANDDKPRSWDVAEVAFVNQVAELIRQAVQRRHAEDRQAVLNAELSHRMKNMMTIVQAMADQTLRNVEDRTAVENLTKRLQALSSAHVLLLGAEWKPSRIMAAVVAALEPFGHFQRVQASGPEIMLGARSVVSLSLLLHELATNALKYGALSNDTGRVTISWEVLASEGDATFVLHWRESGGPLAVEPTRRGFGSRLIKAGLIGTGGVELRYLATGFEADMSAPLAHMQEA